MSNWNWLALALAVAVVPPLPHQCSPSLVDALAGIFSQHLVPAEAGAGEETEGVDVEFARGRAIRMGQRIRAEREVYQRMALYWSSRLGVDGGAVLSGMAGEEDPESNVRQLERGGVII